MACESCTVIAPGTTRWNSMKVGGAGVAGADVVGLQRALAVLGDDLADPADDVWARRPGPSARRPSPAPSAGARTRGY